MAVMNNSSTKIVGFIGSNKVDLLFYLSRILFNIELSVAIVDASEEQILKWSIPDFVECDYINYRGVDIIANSASIEIYKNIDFSHYDIVLVDLGYNIKLLNTIDDFDFIFFITDYQVHNVMKLKTLISAINEKKKAVKLYRDNPECKINERYIDSILQLEEKFEIVAKYKLDLNEMDYKYKIICGYDDAFRFTGLSKAYTEMLKDIVEELYATDNKLLLKAIKLAKRGE
jgi:hypothetical protein